MNLSLIFLNAYCCFDTEKPILKGFYATLICVLLTGLISDKLALDELQADRLEQGKVEKNLCNYLVKIGL